VRPVRQRDLQQDDAALLGAVGLVQRSRELGRPAYLALVVGLAVATFGLGFVALYLTPSGGTAAIWWPAAGTSALLALVYRGPRWQVFVLVGALAALSNIIIGRPLEFAGWAVVVVIIELVVFLTVLGRQGRSAMLSTTRGLVRFIAASIAAASVVGLIGMASFALLVGADPLASFAALVPSHLSALLLIVPLALVPLPKPPHGQQVELVVQLVLTTLVTLTVFAPFQNEAIGALLFPFFGWAAVRFVPIVATIELVLLGAIGSVLTVLGGGPYGTPDAAASPTLLVQVYLLSIALTVQFLTVVRSERAELRAENERRATMLRGGFVGSQVGSMFVRAVPGASPSILEINDVAAELVDASWFDPIIEAWVASGVDDLTTEVLVSDDRTVQVHGRRVPTADGDSVLGLQLVDISDFVAAQRAMAYAVERERKVADEMRALSQQKDDFVSAVSHELRTPITSIVGFAEELHETAADEQRQASEIILRNATRLTEMVEELLELGRMTAPNPVRESMTIDLTTIAADAVADQAATAREGRVTVETDLCETPTLVKGNVNALGRIATNLLANAIKFTPAEGLVRVTTMCEGGTVRLMIDDSGPGISDDDRPRVFERFFRSADASKRQTPGTGLGLSIVKSLVELLEGQIVIERSPLGGARLTVTLPRAAAAAEATAG
jgi:signal transduction histidine kinase